MPKNHLVASLAVAVGLGIGGVAGVIIGIPGVSAAQTTTVPSPADPATPEAPAPDGTTPDRTTPDGARPEGRNCPDKDGGTDGADPSTEGTAADAAVLRGGPGNWEGGATSL